MKKKSRSIIIPAFALGLALLYLLAVRRKAGIYFDTNDDRILTEILAGVISHRPEAHTVYMNSLLAFPISALYRISVNIPWYGGCLILFHWAAYGFMLESACSRCRSVIEFLMVTLTFVMLFFSGMCLLAQIQYTSTSALLAIAGYVCLTLNRDCAKGTLYFILFELLSILLRQDAMLMIQPYGLALCLGLILTKAGWNLREKIKAFGGLLLIVLSLYFLCVSANLLLYHGTPWKDYKQSTKMVEELFDYHGTPKYSDVKDILDRYQVSESAYLSYCTGTVMNWDISVECAKELAFYAKEHETGRRSGRDVANALIRHFFQENHWDMNKLAWMTTLMLLLYYIICKKFYLVLPVLGLSTARTLIWSYLLWRGRHPNRVILPLFVCETAFVLTLFLYDFTETVPRKGRKTLFPKLLLLLGCVLFCRSGFLAGKAQYYYTAKENAGKQAFMNGMWELQEYCSTHPDNKYLIESLSLSYYTGSALEPRTALPRNSIVTGCWYSNSPPMRRRLKNYLDGAEEISLILYQDGSYENHPVVRYISELCSSPPIWTEDLTLSHGGRYTVYRYELPGK